MEPAILLQEFPRDRNRLFEIEDDLKATLEDIEAAKKGTCQGRKVIHLIAKQIKEEAVAKPYAVASKCALVLMSFIGLPMVVIGSWACFNYYQISPMDQVFTDITAMMNYSNEGQAITYLVQGLELIAIPATMLLLSKPYHQAKTVGLRRIYLDRIVEPTLHPNQVRFLIDRANTELAKHGHLPLPIGENAQEVNQFQSQLEPIEEELERDKHTMLSLRNIIRLIALDILKEMKNSSTVSIIKMGVLSAVLVSTAIAAWHPLIMGILGNLAPFYHRSPLALGSKNSETLAETTGLYSNLGHVPEYLATGILITGFCLKTLLRENYHKVRRQLIHRIFDKHIKNDALDPRISDLLYRRKMQELHGQH